MLLCLQLGMLSFAKSFPSVSVNSFFAFILVTLFFQLSYKLIFNYSCFLSFILYFFNFLYLSFYISFLLLSFFLYLIFFFLMNGSIIGCKCHLCAEKLFQPEIIKVVMVLPSNGPSLIMTQGSLMQAGLQINLASN